MTKKRLGFIALLVLPLLMLGCQATQPIAAKAMDTGLRHQDKVFTNLADKHAQLVLNYGAEQAVDAVENSDTTAAQGAVKYVFDEMNELSWLKVQWERGRTLLRTPQEYIWSQKPFYWILWDEWKAAEQEVNADQTTTPE